MLINPASRQVSARIPRHLPPQPAGADALSLMGPVLKYGRKTEIYAEDEPADYIYRVHSGAVRVCKLLSDGRRQISGFYFQGEIFGLEASETHQFCAEAIIDSQIVVIKRSAALEMGERDPDIGRQLWTAAMRDLSRAQDHMLLLGRKTASERVAAFLLEMSRRAGEKAHIELPMSRYDIADYLGLTIETVSRTLTELERAGTIALRKARSLDLCRKSALEQANV